MAHKYATLRRLDIPFTILNAAGRLMGKISSPETGLLLLNGKSIPFVVIRSGKRKRTIAFKIKPEQGLVILAPLRTSLKNLKEMAINNSKWIVNKYTQMEDAKENVAHKKLNTGEHLPYLGIDYPLIINGYYYDRECCLINNELHIYVSKQLNEENRQKVVMTKLKSWYRRRAKEMVQQRLQLWSKTSGLQPEDWRITSALRRWGSCSAKNRICINWRLILVPLDLFDYVIVHELCHIKHKNHSSDFWALVERIMPDYKQKRAELKKQNMHFI